MNEGERCPVCYGTEWEIDYDYTDDGDMQVSRCETCGWPPPAPYSVTEYRAKWLTLGETPWSHPTPNKMRHIAVLIAYIEQGAKAHA